MALSSTAITPVNDPNCLDSSNAASEVYPPQPGTTTTANDVGAGEQILRNQTHTLNEVKVDRAGDTMTGRLIVGATAATNNNAIQATGDGTGAGITAMGGASGNGAIITAGGGNNNGTTSTGAGTGSGVRGVGGATGVGGTFLAGGGNTAGVSASGAGTGAGIVANPGTAQTDVAPTCAVQAAGYVQLTGTDPNAGVDPGANNVIHGASVTKARGRLVVSGAPPYTFADNYNFVTTSTVPGAGTHRVTMVRAMADTNYSVFVNVHGGVGYAVSETNIAGRTTTAFEVTVFATDSLTPGIGTATHIDFRVEGRQ